MATANIREVGKEMVPSCVAGNTVNWFQPFGS